ncbi:MAG TPA: hypothetical protein VMG41_01050 [Gemmatimonadales bacterium]|nr:hypothetical protein [Gemmatimonadales bacterium]
MHISLRRVQEAALAALLIVAVACGGGDSTGPGGGGGGGGGGAGTMSGTVQGQSWAADANEVFVTKGSVPGSLTITASKVVSATNYTSVILALSFIGDTGSYALGTNVGTTPGGIGTVVIQSGATANTWLTSLTGVAGSVTVTGLTSTRISGTFTFTADLLSGSSSSSTATVTNGSFDVSLPTGFTSVPAANHGSSFNATLGGAPFVGATVVGIGASGAFSLGGQTTAQSLNLITNVVADTTGTYALGSAGIRLTVLDIATAHSWGGFAGDSGIVVITSLANGRAVGTFSGTLAPGASSPGPLTVTNGSFDVRIDAP